MAEFADVDLIVEPLRRALLDGVDDGTGLRAVDLAVLPYFEDERPLQGLAGLVDWRTSGRLSALLREGFCTGHTGETVLMPGRPTLPMRRLVLLGLGPSARFDRAAAEATGQRLVQLIEQLQAPEAMIAMPGRVADRAVVEAVFDGLTRALMGPTVEAAARPAAKAVGDEGPTVVDGPGDRSHRGAPDEGEPTPSPVSEARAPERTPLGVAPDPDSSVEPEPSGPALAAATELADAATPLAGADASAEPSRRRIWVVADPRHEARLHRLLDGPPRAAEPRS